MTSRGWRAKIDSDIALYAALGLGAVCCACAWQYRRSTRHPFANQHITIVNTLDESHAATQKLVERSGVTRVLGFDCEWVGSNKIALLQLATADGTCILYRLCKMGAIADELRDLLQDPDVLKVGVAPVEDANLVARDYGVGVYGCVDLRHLAATPGGLARLTSTVLGVELVKDRYVRCSDWEAESLSRAQCDYAARDALAAVNVFMKLVEKKLFKDSLLRRLGLVTPKWEEIVEVCEASVDVRYNDGKGAGKPEGRGRKERGGRWQREKPPYGVLSKDFYENCWILAPDGEQLSTCTRKKVDWYVSNNLGEIVNEDPTHVRLLFEPANRMFNEVWRYQAQELVNRCVVCAATCHLMRKYVVPVDYRRHFPQAMTDRTTHDILPLCVTCHRRSNASDLQFRRRLEQLSFAGGPRTANAAGEKKWIKKRDVIKVKNAANAIQRFADVIPPDRLRMLTDVVKDYFDCEEVTEEVFEAASRLEACELNESFTAHGLDIVNKFKAGPGLEYLQKIWREHFLATMKPKYLPPLWSVDHGHNCDD